MKSDNQVARIAGVLYLIIFLLGVTIYQLLQGSILFSDDFLSTASSHSNQLILSTLLGTLSGTLSIVLSILLLPIIKRRSQRLGYLYVAFCILNFVAISIDGISVLSMLELSKEFVNSDISHQDTFETMGLLLSKTHWWTHYSSLIVSCLPVSVLFFTMFYTRLISRVLSIFGLFAVALMLVELLFSIFGHGISMNMLLPIALIQILFPIWIMIKGFNSQPGS